MASIIPVNGSSFGRAGGRLRRYPGGTENASIFATVRGSIPNRRAASRRLMPSIRTAQRTFAYSSTPFIPQPFALITKSFLPPEFYSGATGLPGYFTEGFCLRRVQRCHLGEEASRYGRKLCRPLRQPAGQCRLYPLAHAGGRRRTGRQRCAHLS